MENFQDQKLKTEINYFRSGRKLKLDNYKNYYLLLCKWGDGSEREFVYFCAFFI